MTSYCSLSVGIVSDSDSASQHLAEFILPYTSPVRHWPIVLMPDSDQLWQGHSRWLHFAGVLCKIVALACWLNVEQLQLSWHESTTVSSKVTTENKNKKIKKISTHREQCSRCFLPDRGLKSCPTSRLAFLPHCSVLSHWKASLINPTEKL